MKHPPDERDMEQVVRSWMRDQEEHPADRSRQVGRIMGRVDETHQRRGAWRLLPFVRGGRRVDDDDLELFAAGRGPVAMRRGVSSALALAAVAVLIVVTATFIALLPRPVAGPGTQPPSSPQATIHPDDAALKSGFDRLWSGGPVSLEDVVAVYTDGARHTSLWLDRVERFDGPSQIRDRLLVTRSVDPGDWIRLPDADRGEHRYLVVTRNLGGIACLIQVKNAQVTRHDCILPTASAGVSSTTFEAPADDTLEAWSAIEDDLVSGWGTADRDLIERTVSPDIVHYVAYDDHETRLEGIDAYMSVMGYTQPALLAPPVALPAPRGDHRWTDFSGIAGGSLCTFWERDGLIVRHDCVVPTFTAAGG